MKHCVGKIGEIAVGQCKLVRLNGREIGLFLVDGEYRAYRNSCPHAGAPICEGRFKGPASPTGIYPYEQGREDGTIRCPSHGWDFDLKTGEYVYGYDTLRSYPVSVEGDDIFIELA